MRSVCLAMLSLTVAALGKQLDANITRSTTPVDSETVQGYVSRLAARFQAGLHTSVVDKLHDPVALPGGYVFIPVSLLLSANSEAEFAGVLAQTIAPGKTPFSNTGSISIIFIGGDPPPRAMELETDIAAVRIMSGAGFDPAALLQYIQRRQPPDAERIAALQEAIRDLPPVGLTDSSEFHRIQAIVRPAPPSLLR